MKAQEIRSAVREHAGEIDNVFMSVLSANMQEAERRGANDALQRLVVHIAHSISLFDVAVFAECPEQRQVEFIGLPNFVTLQCAGKQHGVTIPRRHACSDRNAALPRFLGICSASDRCAANK
jgi:hypothetical protein